MVLPSDTLLRQIPGVYVHVTQPVMILEVAGTGGGARK